MNLFFQRLGEGPPLLIFHGLFGSLDNWRTHAKQLSRHFTVYSVDLRNHGHSPHAERFDYPAMAADVIQLIDDEDLPPVIALGHSMGGKVVMQLANDAPELLEKIIVAAWRGRCLLGSAHSGRADSAILAEGPEA